MDARLMAAMSGGLVRRDVRCAALGRGRQRSTHRQVEKYADIYTSRVSNFLRYTPYKHFICGRQTLTHDREDDVFHWKVSEYGDDDGTGY